MLLPISNFSHRLVNQIFIIEIKNVCFSLLQKTNSIPHQWSPEPFSNRVFKSSIEIYRDFQVLEWIVRQLVAPWPMIHKLIRWAKLYKWHHCRELPCVTSKFSVKFSLLSTSCSWLLVWRTSSAALFFYINFIFEIGNASGGKHLATFWSILTWVLLCMV